MQFKKILAILATVLFSSIAFPSLADDRDLSKKSVNEIPILAPESVDTAADYVLVIDESAGNQPKRVLASAGLLGGGITASTADLNATTNFEETISATTSEVTIASGKTLDVGAGNLQLSNTAVTSTAAELNYNDITTLGTLAASKTWSSDASLDTIMPTGGLLTVQSGAEVDLATGSTFKVESATVNLKQLSLPGRATIMICGDGTTINNNTVYYGPSMVPVAGAGRTCDITQAGNATEGSADEKAFDATAFQVLSMDCLTANPGAAGVSFTLRTAAGATTPSVTCSVANTKLGCTANVQTTTAIASGAVIDIAAASTGDQGSTPFACAIQVAY